MAEETSSLRQAVDRILGQPPGGSSVTDASSAGTGQGPVQLAAAPPLNWGSMLGTQSAIGNTQPNYTPSAPAADQQMLDQIRAQTAALQAQTAKLTATPLPSMAPLPPLAAPTLPAASTMTPAATAAPKPAPAPFVPYSVGGALTIKPKPVATTPVAPVATAPAPSPYPVYVPQNPLAPVAASTMPTVQPIR